MTDEPSPTIRRVLTLALTILLLLTTVPAISLAPDVPDLPEVAPSADATHNCDISITDSTAGGPIQILGCDPCSHTDCSPSTDPCNHVDCTTHPCDFVDCDPDPGQECQKVYDALDKALADLPVYGSSSVSECVPSPPSTNPCDHADCNPSTDPDSAGVGLASGSAAFLGGAGRTTVTDGQWSDVELVGDASFPLVFATTQTANGAQDPSNAQVRSGASDFSTRHCEWDAADACDSHADETNGWAALDPEKVRSISDMDAGEVFIDGSSSTGVQESVTFNADFEQTPLVFAQVQTKNGGEDPLNVQVVSVTTDGATLEFCEQETADGCDGHGGERVAWWAIDPKTAQQAHGWDAGTVSVSDSNWNRVSFGDSEFEQTPIVLAMVQTENGGSEALYPEVKSVTENRAYVRYCESDGDDGCDNHATETVAWLAVEPGALAAPMVEPVRWTTTYPETVLTVDDGYELTGGVHNELDVPILLNVEPHIESPSVCSIQGFSSSSAKPTPRQHEYLLLPNGTDNATDAVGVSGDWDLLNGDSISFSIDVATGDQTGKCEVTLQAMVQTLGGHTIDVSQQSMATRNEEPLPSEKHLGGWSADCTSNTMTPVNRPDDPEVQAGTVQISADVVWPENCADNAKKGVVLVQYRHKPSTEPGNYTNVTSAQRAEAGVATALNQSVDMSKTGEYEFRVFGVLMDDWFDIPCALAIINGGAAGVGYLAAVAHIALIVASGGTVLLIEFALLMAAVIGASIAGAQLLEECSDEVDFKDHYSVTVHSTDQSTTEKLLTQVPGGLLG